MRSGFVSPTPRYFFQHVMEPTRHTVTYNPGTLDLILTNEDNMVESKNDVEN